MSNEALIERYELAKERIAEIVDSQEVYDWFKDYFQKTAGYISRLTDIYEKINSCNANQDGDQGNNQDDNQGKNQIKRNQILKDNNRLMYEDILPENYDKSYANPDYAKENLADYYDCLSFLVAEIYSMPAYVCENKLFDMVILMELFVEVYGLFASVDYGELPSKKSVSEAIYYHVYDYIDEIVTERTYETLKAEESFARDIVMNSDLNDLSYLYSYGEYISDNELQLAEYLNSKTDEEIEKMAFTYTDGFRRGFITMRIDMSKKKTVNIRYFIGQERIVRAAIKQFEAMGLKSILNRYATNRSVRRLTIRQGYSAQPVNRQFDFDHRMDDALFLDKAFIDRKLSVTKKAYEELKEDAAVFAGPAVIEVFGEKDFVPVMKESAVKYSDKQKKLSVSLMAKSQEIVNSYIIPEERSFTIIAFPIPEIGTDFNSIFDETMVCNTLDNDKYTKIQQTIIDALDKADYAVVKGAGANKTDIKVNLYKLNDPDKETIFENCVADVNIPVGEVFTSPVLTGTNGILNVSHAYLNELPYDNLTLIFKDGMVSDYTCDNFEEEEKNKDYIKENLLFCNDSLPIGEFAIGTNTTAYVMGRKFNIIEKLPILIVEKTGPHFAIGDTCYSHSEEHRVYNQNGKEIVARENECSLLRHSEETKDKAYFNCHTDITIPYNELALIEAVNDKTGYRVTIIKDGRFVLEGTEELNAVLDQYDGE